MQIGDRIFRLREEKRLTQKQLAEMIGISRAALSHYENNRRQPDYETLKKLAEYFGVMVDEIIGNSAEKTDGAKDADCAAESSQHKQTEGAPPSYPVAPFGRSAYPGR